ncbi:proline iminopeptidase-family hydrolase [Kitasatospora sp. NPDC057541]|uniref:proline iminopeptidase-family hydrolase n=1 Tax=unclassified Kitasatospora TaxID=2633591 RepID=UPI0036BD5A8B
MRREVDVRTGFVPTPQGRLAYRAHVPDRTDRIAGLPLLVLHGGPGMPAAYLSPLFELADERPVILFDQLGCGRSDRAADPAALTLEVFTEHVDLVREHLGHDRVHLFGHSWGGLLALSCYSAHPGRVASLVLASPLVSVDRWCEDARRLTEELPAPLRQAIDAGPGEPGYADAEKEFYRRHFCALDPWPGPLRDSMSRLATDVYESMWGPNEFSQTGTLRGTDLSGIAATVDIPTLWIAGSDDEARPGTLRELAGANPRSEFAVLPGTHNVHLEQPETYLAAVRRFLDTH